MTLQRQNVRVDNANVSSTTLHTTNCILTMDSLFTSTISILYYRNWSSPWLFSPVAKSLLIVSANNGAINTSYISCYHIPKHGLWFSTSLVPKPLPPFSVAHKKLGVAWRLSFQLWGMGVAHPTYTHKLTEGDQTLFSLYPFTILYINVLPLPLSLCLSPSLSLSPDATRTLCFLADVFSFSIKSLNWSSNELSCRERRSNVILLCGSLNFFCAASFC